MVEEKTNLSETWSGMLDAMLDKKSPLLIINEDDDIQEILPELDRQLLKRGLYKTRSKSKPYHFVEIHHDGDMLDGLQDIYLSNKSKNSQITASDLLSSRNTRQYKFFSMVNLLAQDKFIIFHIKEDVLRLFFEVAIYQETRHLIDQPELQSESVPSYDEQVLRFFNKSTLRHFEDESTQYSLCRLLVMFLDLTASFMHLGNYPEKTLVIMSWRSYVILNRTHSALDTWSYRYFQIYDLSMRDLAFIPGMALQRFLSELNLPPDLSSRIKELCDTEYPHVVVQKGSWEGSFYPPNVEKWNRLWVEQMTKLNVPQLVEGKLRDILHQTSLSDESIDSLITDVKNTQHGRLLSKYDLTAYKKLKHILIEQNIPGEVITFILDIMTKGFGQTLREEREVKKSSKKVTKSETGDRIKIAILGFDGVGKTTLLHALKGELLSLDSIPVESKKSKQKARDLDIVSWDLSGQSRFSLLWAKMIENAQVVIIVTDSTLENVIRSKRLVSFVREESPQSKIIAIANKQDLPTSLTPDRVSQILGLPTYGISAIDPTSFDALDHLERAIVDKLAETSLAVYFRYVTATLYENEGEMLDILQKFDSAKDEFRFDENDISIGIEHILDATLSRSELRRWLLLYFHKIRLTTQTVNSLVQGLERGMIEAQNEARRILTEQRMPSQIIEWFISKLSQ